MTYNITNATTSNSTNRNRPLTFEVYGILFLYILIFLLAVVGNCCVIITLLVNKVLRTVTNVLLLNLAGSDLLMAIVCMPPLMVAFFTRQWVLGVFMCKLKLYIQGKFKFLSDKKKTK